MLLFYFTLFVFRCIQVETDKINGQIGAHKLRRNRIYFWCAMYIMLAMAAIGGGRPLVNGILGPWFNGGKSIA
jgi:hypothetical protein